MRAIRITEFGGPEVLRLVDDHPEPEPRDGFDLLEIDTAGINYADTHQVDDSYLAPSKLPLIPGAEAVGHLSDGRRVVGLLAGGSTDLPLGAVLAKRLVVRGTVLRSRAHHEKAGVARGFAREVVPLLADGRVAPVVEQVLPLARATEAYDLVGSNTTVGKVVLTT